ncbi:unnamed protein product [Schistosoma margrebowiei]|uniref:Uncharacterized protein n=1 Tax=Schistosoma margrebowiei TaxID=48269 RepID=A0A183N0L5_9TREM|nr:unnamed protein product [Schistosoma margrebowiei]
MNGCVDGSLHESLTSSNLDETVAVINNPPSSPKISILQTCSVVDSNHIVSETQCTNGEFSSSQRNDVSLNAHEIVAVTAREETENKASNIMSTVEPNGIGYSVTNISDKSNYRGSLIVLPDMLFFNDSYVFD